MARTVTLIYNNNAGPSCPTGGTPNQALAGVAAVSVYAIATPITPISPLPGNPDAASVIFSNGEQIGNAQYVPNPLPPGIIL